MAGNNYNWLAPFRKVAGYTQEALATALSVSTQTVKRWENFRSVEQIPFDRLAEALGVTEERLCEAHRAGYQYFLEERYMYLIEAFDEVDEALKTKLLEELKADDSLQAAQKLSSDLGDKKKIEILGGLYPIGDAIRKAQSTAELYKIRDLVALIAMAAMQIPSKFQEGREIRIHGEQHDWILRMVVDGMNNHRMNAVRAKTRDDLDRNSLRVAAMPKSKVDSDKILGRVYECVKEIADVTGMSADRGEPPVPLSDRGIKEFDEYCVDLDGRLLQTNRDPERSIFARTLEESQEVKDALFYRLPRLQLFDCGYTAEAHLVTNLDHNSVRQLEMWFANWLYKIQQREEQITTHTHADKKGRGTMSERKDAIHSEVHLTVESVENLAVSAGGNSTISNGADVKELLKQLEEIRALCIIDNQGHRQLRNDVRDILEHLGESGELPKNGKTWLESARDGLATGDKLVGLVSKALDIWEKLPLVFS